MHPCINRWPKIKSLHKEIKNIFFLQYTLSFLNNILVNLTIVRYNLTIYEMGFYISRIQNLLFNVIAKFIMIGTFAKNDLLKGIDCLHSTSSSFIVLKVLKVYCLKAFFGMKPIRPRNFNSFIATNIFG